MIDSLLAESLPLMHNEGVIRNAIMLRGGVENFDVKR
jgi:hypothetical protein